MWHVQKMRMGACHMAGPTPQLRGSSAAAIAATAHS